jgi:uncharacterized protein YukE
MSTFSLADGKRINGKPRHELATIEEAYQLAHEAHADAMRQLNQHTAELGRALAMMRADMLLTTDALMRLDARLQDLERRTWRGRWRRFITWVINKRNRT